MRADLLRIDWFQFEKVVAALYESRGNQVERRGGANPDGGIDLVLYKNDKKSAVQCKHWKAWKVGIARIREFVGAMKIEGFEHGIFVVLQECTREAKDLAQKNGIKIVDGAEKMLEEVQPDAIAEIRRLIDDPTKHCPKCGAPMVLRSAESGFYRGSRFWGCSTYPSCRGKMRWEG